MNSAGKKRMAGKKRQRKSDETVAGDASEWRKR